MKKYKHLKIAGHKVQVKWLTEKEIGTISGQCWQKHNIIKINNQLPESRQEEVLLHEILHFIHSNLGYEKDEQLVTALGEALYQVLKDNKINF